MKIEKLAYDKFYYVLFDAYIERVLEEEEWNAIGREVQRYSPQLWDITRVENGRKVNLISKINNGTSRDTRIYYRYLTDYNTDKAIDGYLEINDDVLVESIKFLELELEGNLQGDLELTPELEAPAYFQLFLEKHFPKYLNKNPKYRVVDFKRDIILQTEQRKNEALSNNNTIIEHVEYSQSSGMNYEIIKLVNDFYRYVAHEKLRPKGWDLLSESFKKKYGDGFEGFNIGYTNTEYIKDLHIWDIKIHGDLASCNVFYLDSIRTHTSYDLVGIDKIKLENIDVFVSIANSLVEKSKSTDLQNVEKVELCKLFDPSVSEYIWYKGGKNPDAINQLLPDERSITVPRLLNVECIRVDEKWLIKGIVPIASRLIR